VHASSVGESSTIPSPHRRADHGGVRRPKIVILSSNPELAQDVQRVCDECSYDALVLTRVEALPQALVGAHVAFVDLDMPASNPQTLSGPNLVHALRFLRPELELLTYKGRSDPQASASMAEMNVAWHYRSRPSKAALTVQIGRCVRRAQARLSQEQITLKMDASRRIASLESELARFSSTEMRFLVGLVEARDSVVRREEIVGRIWAENPPSSDRAIDLVAFKVRRKLAHHFGFPNAIRSVRGIGYRLALPSYVRAVVTPQR